MASITIDKGILITYYDYDAYNEDGRTGSLLSLYDIKNGGIVDLPSRKYSKEKLAGIFSELEQLCNQGEDPTLATAKIIFQKYGL